MRVAFIIPVDATRHIKFAELLSAFVSPLSDVFVVLSRPHDASIWNVNVPPCGIQLLVLSDWVPEEAIVIAERNRGMPTFKKWQGLHRVMTTHDGLNRYKYCICCDSEIRLLRPLDEEFLNALPSQFTFIGDHPARSAWHDNFSGQVLATTRARLTALLSSAPPSAACGLDTVYTWWSGLPIYAVDESLRDFFKEIGIADSIALAERINCTVFDHLVYQRYVISRGLHNARIVCLSHDLGVSTGWSLECLVTSRALKASVEAGLATLWVSKVTRSCNPRSSTVRAYIEYHLDRTIALE